MAKPLDGQNLDTKNPKRLRNVIQGMARELESMDAVYLLKDGRQLEPVIPHNQKP